VSSSGDDRSEMPRPGPLDDDAIDALLAGRARGDAGDGLASFIEELRAAVGAVPTPSPVLAAAIAAGGIATFQPPVAKWRMLRTRIQGFLAGTGVAAKVALGAGVAAAAITGAAAVGVLPGPIQHAVSEAIGAVTPFSFPDPGNHHGTDRGNLAGGDATTSTTVGAVTTTTAPVERSHDGNGAVVTPTTSGAAFGDGAGDTTATTGPGNGSNDGNGGGIGTTPTTVANGGGNGTTPTTVANGGGNGTTSTTVPNGGDGTTPKFLSIDCERGADPARVTCRWSASTSADHARYVLFRTGDGNGRVVLETANALTFTDSSVVPGTAYGYRVTSFRADGSIDSHSPLFRIECCGAPTTTTPTTATTAHYGADATTTTTVREGDGAKATTKP
jgi:hypothetical protein